MNNTINNVPRELLRDIETHLDNIAEFDPTYAPETMPLNTSAELLIPLRALLSAPSPAGVDGLEVVGYSYGNGILINDTTQPDNPMYTKLVRLSAAQAIIDGLRGEVERLQRAEKNDAIAYKAAIERQGELRTERDQQAQRIGELEGLLMDFAYHTQRREMPTESSLAAWADRIEAALSAGKEGE